MRAIDSLHSQIDQCRRCAIGCDEVRVNRILETTESDICVIGQAPGSRTQRLSGLPYRSSDGSISATGQRLDAFLRQIGNDLTTVYITDAMKCYPGKSKSGDRQPSTAEINNCLPWLRQELEIVKPKIVIALGSVAALAYTKVEAPIENSPTDLRCYLPHPAYFRWQPKQCQERYSQAAETIIEYLNNR